MVVGSWRGTDDELVADRSIPCLSSKVHQMAIVIELLAEFSADASNSLGASRFVTLRSD